MKNKVISNNQPANLPNNGGMKELPNIQTRPLLANQNTQSRDPSVNPSSNVGQPPVLGSLSAYLQTGKTPKVMNGNQQQSNQVRHSSLRNHIKGTPFHLLNYHYLQTFISIT